MDTIQRRREKPERTGLLFLCFLAALALVLLWRCRFGFASNDEAFYLTIPYRLLQGDALLTEEWHLSQLSGFLLMPAVWIFTTLTGGTEGILLFMRYLCIITQTAAALFLYSHLKAFSRLGAAVAALGFVLFIPLSICALSYNSMGILFLTLSQVILITGKSCRSYLPAGLCFAAAVLCCPYLLLVYGAYLLIVLGALVWSRIRREAVHPALSVAGALWFTAGAAIAALLFTLFVLSRSSVSDILPCLKLMMNDPSIERYLSVTEERNGNITKKVYWYNNHRIIKVPSERFYTKINLLTGAGDQAAGGYTPATGAKHIGMLMIQPMSILQLSKRRIARVWAPTKEEAAGTDGVNPNADAWRFDFRIYHDAWMLEEKIAGVYAATIAGDGIDFKGAVAGTYNSTSKAFTDGGTTYKARTEGTTVILTGEVAKAAEDKVKVIDDTPTVKTEETEKVILADEPAKTEEAVSPEIGFMGETAEEGQNNNEKILEMHRQGKSTVAIARELGLGVGEVKLVIDLYKA